MSMKMYINAWCETERRNPGAWERHWGGGDYDDDYYDRPARTPKRHIQSTPHWLARGLQQYLELLDEDKKIASRQRGGRFGHLAASAQQGRQASFFEVTSDALYLPPGVKVGKKAVGEHCLVVQTSFSLGVRSGETPEVKPRLTLDLVEVGGESREDIIRAAEAKGRGEVQLREEDLVDDEGVLQSLARVKSGIAKPKTNPRVSDPLAREQVDGAWEVPRHPGEAAGGLLKASLSPVLDDRLVQVRIDAPAPVPAV